MNGPGRILFSLLHSQPLPEKDAQRGGAGLADQQARDARPLEPLSEQLRLGALAAAFPTLERYER